MIDKREWFVFWIWESQTKKTPVSIQVIFGKEGTEQHNFQEAYDHYSVKVLFAPLDLAINEWLSIRFSENDLGNLGERTGVAVSSNRS